MDSWRDGETSGGVCALRCVAASRTALVQATNTHRKDGWGRCVGKDGERCSDSDSGVLSRAWGSISQDHRRPQKLDEAEEVDDKVKGK